jgi:hypothetical protein
MLDKIWKLLRGDGGSAGRPRDFLALRALLLAVPVVLACEDGNAACDTSVWNGTPCAPVAPTQYALPSGALAVSTYSQLSSAVAGTTARDIILEDGTYSGGVLSMYTGHRLWARHVGKAVLTGGVEVLAKNVGIHGLKFTITSNGGLAANNKSAVIHSSYGNFGRNGDGVWVADVTIDGGNVALYGIWTQAPNGVKIERVVLTKFRYEGIIIKSYGTTAIYPNPAVQVRDVDVSYVKDTAGLNNGTAEFGILLGNSSPGTIVERVNCHHIDWSCILPGGVDVGNATFSDIRMDYTNDHAFYIEHYTHDITLKRFYIGPHAWAGIAIESASEGWGWKPSGKNYKFFDGTIDTTRAGVDVGACNGPEDFQRIKFLHQCQAAFLDNSNVPYNAGHCTPAGPMTQSNNTFQMQSTAKIVIKNQNDFGPGLCDGAFPW